MVVLHVVKKKKNSKHVGGTPLSFHKCAIKESTYVHKDLCCIPEFLYLVQGHYISFLLLTASVCCIFAFLFVVLRHKFCCIYPTCPIYRNHRQLHINK